MSSPEPASAPLADWDTAELLELATATAQAAGAELLARWSDAHRVQTKSSATDPVTEADRAVETLLVEQLTAARPLDGMIGEEGARRRSRSGLSWVIDPLDGTVNYLYGRPDWSVSVAAVDGVGGVVGVVGAPVLAETYTAVRGQGAWLHGARFDGVRLAVNEPVRAAVALVATGFAYEISIRRQQGETAARLLPAVRDIRRAGSAALDLCAVAAGRADGYLEEFVNLWDWAAGALVAVEAGAVVRALRTPPDVVGVVAAGSSLLPELLAVAGVSADRVCSLAEGYPLP